MGLIPTLVLITAAPTVPRYGVYEHSIDWPSAGYTNPWEDVRLAVVLTSPSGREIKIGGFYYGPDAWRFRFAPSEVGEWTWKAEIKDGDKTGASDGAFKVVESDSPGFVRQSPYNKFRWVFDDGSPYYPLGFGDCVRAPEGQSPLEKTGFDGGFRVGEGQQPGRTAGWDDCLSAFSQTGLNIFRWSVDNCAFGLYDKIDPTGNVYKQREGIWGDQLCEMLRRHGFRIYMAFFGFKPPFPNDSADHARMQAVKRVVDYVVNRYGAYVDFWELMNEYPNKPDTIDDDWYRQVAGYLKSIDPYRHPVSTSWQRPDIAEIDICSPHWYERENEFDSDWITRRNFERWKEPGKPVIVGEQGNRFANWDARSAVRMRIRTWTTFFMEGALIFWNTSMAKDYHNEAAANIYLGPEERGYLKALQDFTRGFDPRAEMVEVEDVTPRKRLRAFALSGPANYALYLHNYIDHAAKNSGFTAKIAPRFAGTATWIDPATGKTLATQKLPAGEQTISVPEFVIDAALKIER